MKLDDIRKLHQKKYRAEFGHFLVEGEHLALELQKAALHCERRRGDRRDGSPPGGSRLLMQSALGSRPCHELAFVLRACPCGSGDSRINERSELSNALEAHTSGQ